MGGKRKQAKMKVKGEIWKKTIFSLLEVSIKTKPTVKTILVLVPWFLRYKPPKSESWGAVRTTGLPEFCSAENCEGPNSVQQKTVRAPIGVQYLLNTI